MSAGWARHSARNSVSLRRCALGASRAITRACARFTSPPRSASIVSPKSLSWRSNAKRASPRAAREGHAVHVPQHVRGALDAVAGRQLAQRRQVLTLQARPGLGEVHHPIRQLPARQPRGVLAAHPHEGTTVPAADLAGALAPLVPAQEQRRRTGRGHTSGPLRRQAPRPVAHRETATLGVGHQRVALVELAALPGDLVPEPFQAHRLGPLSLEAHMRPAPGEFHTCKTTNTCTCCQLEMIEYPIIHSKSPEPNKHNPNTPPNRLPRRDTAEELTPPTTEPTIRTTHNTPAPALSAPDRATPNRQDHQPPPRTHNAHHVGGHEMLPGGGQVVARWRPAVLPVGGRRGCPR